MASPRSSSERAPRRAALLALFALSCGGGEPPGESAMAVVTSIGFASRNGEMAGALEVSEGLDLDDRVSAADDRDTCRRADFVAPDGRAGIDNQFSYLFEVVEDMAEEGTVEGIVQGSINNGRLLLMIDVQGVDDWVNDDSVTVRVFNGVGRPTLGSDGYIVPDQTFDRDPGSDVNSARGRIVDGVLETDPFFVELPMAFFNVFFDLRLQGARLRAHVGPEGVTDGVIGGGLSIDDILLIAEMADAMQEIQFKPLLEILLPGLADLELVGTRCSALSANLVFDSRRAFVFAGEPPPLEETPEGLEGSE